MALTALVAQLLADGRFHSGNDMGDRLGVSRAAVCKAVRSLVDAGLEIHRVPGRGYRLPHPLQPLDRQAIVDHLRGPWSGLAERLILLTEVDSTNRHLLQLPVEQAENGVACVAEMQTGGRGRHGRRWEALPYRSITLSVGWRFSGGAAMVSGLSLAAGVAVVQAMAQCGQPGIRLKWPNDLLWQGRKLGGLLVDIRGEATGPCWVVLGVGLNLYRDPSLDERIPRPWAALEESGVAIDRNRMVASLINQLWNMFGTFEKKGFPAFAEDWQSLHEYDGRQVTVHTHSGNWCGTVLGVDETGALRLRDEQGELRRVLAGEISLSPLP